jgi:hypothetical protein
MGRYKCKSCRYDGDKFVFQFNDYTYCVASNGDDPEYIGACPDWVPVSVGDAEIGEPVGCPKCHAWGVGNFE